MPTEPPASLLGSIVRGALTGSVLLFFAGSRVAPMIIADQYPSATLRSGASDALVADLERLGKLGFFAGIGTTSDAAPTLNGLIAADREVAGMTAAWWAAGDAFAPPGPLSK